MFRMGGSAGEGITSGLAPRQGYKNANRVYKFDELNPEKNKQTVVPGNTGSTGSSSVGGGTGSSL